VGSVLIPTFECTRDDTHEPLKGEWLKAPREAIEWYVETDEDADPELLDILCPPDMPAWVTIEADGRKSGRWSTHGASTTTTRRTPWISTVSPWR
jgi:hypothetical protein